MSGRWREYTPPYRDESQPSPLYSSPGGNTGRGRGEGRKTLVDQTGHRKKLGSVSTIPLDRAVGDRFERSSHSPSFPELVESGERGVRFPSLGDGTLGNGS